MKTKCMKQQVLENKIYERSRSTHRFMCCYSNGLDSRNVNTTPGHDKFCEHWDKKREEFNKDWGDKGGVL